MNDIVCLNSANLEGFNTETIKVEISIKKGIPKFSITGLAATSIKESSERVRIAIENSGYKFPKQSIVVNLAPAGTKKDGTYLDLPIAAGILIATGQIELNINIKEFLIIGELGLNGTVKHVKGVINILYNQKEEEISSCIVPFENKDEAALIDKYNIYSVKQLSDLEAIFSQKQKKEVKTYAKIEEISRKESICIYKDQIIGLKAVEICVTGWHHLLFKGTPGTGKTFLAKLAESLMPRLNQEECLDILKVKSNFEKLKELRAKRPFRSPHHTASDMAIVGGGKEIRMGEVSLSNRGILFLDELAEFKPNVIQSLREPMEEGKITISRVSGNMIYPSNFLLICATNPCPCGYLGSHQKKCICNDYKVKNYNSKYSGPFLDRIEVEVEINIPMEERVLIEVDLKETYQRIEKAVQKQKERYKNTNYFYNGMLRGNDVDKFIQLDSEADSFYKKITKKLNLSVRKMNSIKKVARTLADIEDKNDVEYKHLCMAINFQLQESLMTKI